MDGRGCLLAFAFFARGPGGFRSMPEGVCYLPVRDPRSRQRSGLLGSRLGECGALSRRLPIGPDGSGVVWSGSWNGFFGEKVGTGFPMGQAREIACG